MAQSYPLGWEKSPKKEEAMMKSRRDFLRTCGAVGYGLATTIPRVMGGEGPAAVRTYHLSISPDALQADPDLLEFAHRAGVTDVWLTGFLYGHWYYPIEKTRPWAERAERLGMAAHWINVPLGHPGDSLGSMSGAVPLTPPRHWRLAVRPDGTTFAGTSLHTPATDENCAALRKLQAAGATRVFLDDDFRLAQGPGVIGGCFCEEHKRRFLERTGFGESQWRALREAVAQRSLTPVLRAWVEFTCDQLSACFRAQQAAAPSIRLGNMIMYLGAEKAGLRLPDYREAPFRVGELMFDDASFTPVKGKTNELFSALFHRRFARPELAYSETTAYPADRLSARNMAAKLAVSTLSDVRNTMFMSGVTAFPKAHWQTLGPAMKRQAEQHRRVAGHARRGPFKHFWGEASRYVGDDNPYSLFLAVGVPFEVTDAPAPDGYSFLSDADAAAATERHAAGGAQLIARPRSGLPAGVRGVQESLAELFTLKREVAPRLERDGVPYVEGETPVVCAWYPTARAMLLWNLSERREALTLHHRGGRREVSVDGLDTTLIEEVGA
jgi:hypothetical protein